MPPRPPFGKKGPPSGNRHGRQERRRLPHGKGHPTGASKHGGQKSGGPPSHGKPGQRQARQRQGRSAAGQNQSDQRRIRLIYAAAVTALTGILIFALQGPLSGNAAPGTIQAMTMAAIPLGLLTFWATRYARPAKAVAIYLAAFACMGLHAKFRVRDYLDTSIDFVVILQGLIFAGFLATGAMVLGERSARFKKPALVLLAIILTTAMLSNIGAPDPQYSAFSTIALVATLVFATYCAMVLSPSDLASVAILGTAPIVLLSFVVYLFPGHTGDFVWMHETGARYRLEGIANNPIGLSLFCAIHVFGLYYKSVLADRKEFGWVAVSCILIPIALICLWASGSRGPSIGLVAAVTLSSVLVLRPFGRATVPIFCAGIAVTIPLLYFTVTEALSNASLSAFARSGDAEEVATMTGRTEIWGGIAGLIGEAPLLGYGMGAPLQVLSEFSTSPTFNIVEAHNLFLHSSLMIGLPGAAAIIALIAYGLFRAHNKRHGFALIALLYFAVTGITENYLFSNRPNWHTLLFFAVVLSAARERSPKPVRAAGSPGQPPGGAQGAALGSAPGKPAA